MKIYLDHRPKRVALVAMGPSIVGFLGDTLTQELTPDWVDEVWTINMASFAIRHDVVFWMDDLVSQREFRPPLIDLLNRHGTPVITSKRHPQLVANSWDYPIQEVSDISFEVFGRPYFNNGVAMAVAYALWKGVETLRVYGADFTYPDRNYAETGRGCIEGWLVYCMTKGMTVEVTPGTSLFDMRGSCGVYGYAEQPEIAAPDGSRVRYIAAPEGWMGLGYAATDSRARPVPAFSDGEMRA